VLNPTKVKVLREQSISRVSCGGNFTVAVDELGPVYSWGEDRDFKVASLRGVFIDMISSGSMHTVAAQSMYIFIPMITWQKRVALCIHGVQ
jgi:hypothetical protein